MKLIKLQLILAKGQIILEYTYIVTAILAILVWFMPKRMKRSDMLVIWIFVSYIEIVVDLFLGHIVGLYYFVGETKISPEALGLKLIMSPLFGIIFINFMPKNTLSRIGSFGSSFLQYSSGLQSYQAT